MRRLIVLTSMFALLLAGPALAEEVTATDGDGNTFGDAQGFRIDFDATPAASAVWDPPLLSGKTYNLESVSVRSSNTNATPEPSTFGSTGQTGSI